jgi:hypothetical protein
MIGITVSVEYADLLAVTLPRNARHFERVLVATTQEDQATLDVVADIPNASAVVTDAFYEDGAWFNKGLAIEEAIDCSGRNWGHWYICFDADVLMPDSLPLPELQTDTLYAPWRRILADMTQWERYLEADSWDVLPQYQETWEFAGAFLLFSGNAPHLQGKRHWFGINWRHAGGYDSDFYYQWPEDKRCRLGWDVLHLGNHGQNWFGRRTPTLSGETPENAHERAHLMDELPGRRKREGYGWEKLS